MGSSKQGDNALRHRLQNDIIIAASIETEKINHLIFFNFPVVIFYLLLLKAV